MAAALLTTDVIHAGLLSSAVSGGVVAGEFLGAVTATPGGHIRWKLMFAMVGTTAFIGALAAATEKVGMATAFVVLAGMFVGIIEAYTTSLVTIVIDDQTDIGVAVGTYGSLRSVGGAITSKSKISNPCCCSR